MACLACCGPPWFQWREALLRLCHCRPLLHCLPQQASGVDSVAQGCGWDCASQCLHPMYLLDCSSWWWWREVQASAYNQCSRQHACTYTYLRCSLRKEASYVKPRAESDCPVSGGLCCGLLAALLILGVGLCTRSSTWLPATLSIGLAMATVLLYRDINKRRQKKIKSQLTWWKSNQSKLRGNKQTQHLVTPQHSVTTCRLRHAAALKHAQQLLCESLEAMMWLRVP